MKALLGARKTATILRLAVAFAIVGSIDGVHRTVNTSRHADICFLIDGQIYCIPGTGNETTGVHARPGPQKEDGLRATRPEDIGLGMDSSQPGKAAATDDGRAV